MSLGKFLNLDVYFHSKLLKTAVRTMPGLRESSKPVVVLRKQTGGFVMEI